MSQFQQGCDRSYEEIVRRWESRMLSFFYRAVGDMDTAKDLRQELFVRLYVRGESYRGNGSLGAWLYSIATNLIRTYFRNVRKARPAEDLDAVQESELAEPSRNGAAAAEVVQQNERARLVREMLGALSPKDRDVLILRFFGDLRFREIARILGVPEGAARVRAYTALDRLRRVIEERGFHARDLL